MKIKFRKAVPSLGHNPTGKRKGKLGAEKKEMENDKKKETKEKIREREQRGEGQKVKKRWQWRTHKGASRP